MYFAKLNYILMRIQGYVPFLLITIRIESLNIVLETQTPKTLLLTLKCTWPRIKERLNVIMVIESGHEMA